MSATFDEISYDTFKLTFSGTDPVRILGVYADETHQYNMTSGPDVVIPEAWLQKIRSAYLRRCPFKKPSTTAARKARGFYGFLKLKTSKAQVQVQIPAPSENKPPDFIYVAVWPGTNASVTVQLIGGDTVFKNDALPKKALAHGYATDLAWKEPNPQYPTKTPPEKKRVPRTPVPVAGNELIIENAENVTLGPPPFPAKEAKDYGVYKSRHQCKNDAYGSVLVRNTDPSAPLTTNLLYGNLRIWKPDPTDPTKTISQLTMDGGAAGITVDRRIQLSPKLPGPNNAPTTGKKAKFSYPPGAEYCSEGELPEYAGSISNGPSDTYESRYIYSDSGDVLREVRPLNVVGSSAKDTLRVSGRAVSKLPVKVTNSTLEVWLTGPAEDSKKRLPTLGTDLGNLEVASDGVVRLKYPYAGLLDYATWVRTYKNDRLVNWTGVDTYWEKDLYDAAGMVTRTRGSTDYVNPTTSAKTTVPRTASYDARSMYRFNAFTPAEDTWEGTQLKGSGTLEVDAQDSVFLLVTGQDTSKTPVTYLYDKANPMVTAVYLSQKNLTPGYNYSHIKDFTGTIKVSEGHAVCVPTVVVGDDDTTPEGTALITQQKAYAAFKASQLNIDAVKGARATFAVCGDVLLPGITGTAVTPTTTVKRASRVVFKNAYCTPSGGPLPDAKRAVYATRLKPSGPLSAYHGEVVIGKNLDVDLDTPETAAHLAAGTNAPASAKLRLEQGVRVLLGTAGIYDISRATTVEGACELVASDDCTVRANMSGPGSLAIKPATKSIKLRGTLAADAQLHDGALVLTFDSELRGKVEFAPNAVTQSDRVIKTRTDTIMRGRQVYGGKLVLGPNGILQIGSR